MRHRIQRRNRARLKADTVVLLDRIATHLLMERLAENSTNQGFNDSLRLEIAELRLRLVPAPGMKAPIIHTGYTK